MIGELEQNSYTVLKEASLQPEVSTEKGKQKTRLIEWNFLNLRQLKSPQKDNLQILVLIFFFCHFVFNHLFLILKI